jgi:hypothetical protein
VVPFTGVGGVELVLKNTTYPVGVGVGAPITPDMVVAVLVILPKLAGTPAVAHAK